MIGPNLYSNNPTIEQHVDRLLPIANLLRDSGAEEICIDSGGRVYTDCGKGMRNTGLTLPETALHTVIRLLVAANGGFLDPEAPFANLTLACGARFHGALPPVANEPQISIRVHSGMARPLSDFMTAAQIRVVTDAIVAKKTLMIGGPTSSGKTTLLNAIIEELIPVDQRLVIIQDTPELQPSSAREVVGRLATNRADLKAHVFQSLRTRPDWIIIGETRDRSAWDLMDASRTGHPALSTVHASSAGGILTRLMSLAGCDQQFVNEAVDLAIFVERFPDGHRKVTQILAKQPDLTWASGRTAQ
jgi:type IV secretion system protein VirB11